MSKNPADFPLQFVPLHSSDYPALLRQIPDPPAGIYVIGNLQCLNQQTLSVVGARSPALESLQWMRAYLKRFVAEGLVLVSGGARGIDQEAHRLSLLGSKPTVVVLPSGLATPYPKSLADWYGDIVKNGGCLVSEYPPQQEMHKHHFLRRNRIISGLSRATLVVEAARRSGSWMTGRLARDQGRTVAVLPGFPLDVRRQGCVDLLVDGAEPLRDDLDLETFIKINCWCSGV